MQTRSWTVQFAPQMQSILHQECKQRRWTFAPSPSTHEYAQIKTDNENPALELPFIRRQWRHDFLWPGALALQDFTTRAGVGLIERFGHHLNERSEITVLSSFRDRSHLASRLRSQLEIEFKKAVSTNEKSQPSNVLETPLGQNTPGLYVLLTPKTLIASCMTPSQFGVNDVMFPMLSESDSTSRAAKKIQQALAQAIRMGFLQIKSDAPGITADRHNATPSHFSKMPLAGQLWLDLGASPGGITESLVNFGAQVVAVDRAPLHPRLHSNKSIHFLQDNISDMKIQKINQKTDSRSFDGIVCDMNGPPLIASQAILRLTRLIKPGALLVFTLKLKVLDNWKDDLGELLEHLCNSGLFTSNTRDQNSGMAQQKSRGPFRHLGTYHLKSNRNELTLVFERLTL